MPISFYALITPLGRSQGGSEGEHPDNTLPGIPVFPAHPIVIPPDGLAPGVPTHPIYIPVYPDQGLPGEQPGIDNSLPGQQPGVRPPLFPSNPIVIPPDAIAPGLPSHPIYIPPYPDQGLPGQQPGVDNSLPGQQPKPDQGLPGQQPRPDQGLPGQQPGVDNSLPGSQPGVDNSLPPVIVFPPLPPVIPEDAEALVMVKYRNEGAKWMYLTDDDQLKPIEGGAQPKKAGRKGK